MFLLLEYLSYHSQPQILTIPVTMKRITAAIYFSLAIRFPPMVEEITEGILASIEIMINSEYFIGVSPKK